MKVTFDEFFKFFKFGTRIGLFAICLFEKKREREETVDIEKG